MHVNILCVVDVATRPSSTGAIVDRCVAGLLHRII